jgi:hypothetical protein
MKLEAQVRCAVRTCGRRVLFPRVLLLLCEREALSLFSSSCAFLGVVSAFAVSHKP